MKKNYFSLLLTLLLSMVSTTALAYDFNVGGIYYNITSSADLTVEVTYNRGSGYGDYSGKISVPEDVTYNGLTYNVTGIGDNAFIDCSGMSSVVLPNSITYIGNSAFSECYALKSIIIPENVNSIGSYAFDECIFTSITIPENVRSIGQRAFYNCNSLDTISIPENISTIGEYAFKNTLWYDKQSDGVLYIAKVALGYKGTMPNNTHISFKEGTLGISSFRSFSNLESIIIPNSVISIEEKAFNGCSGLTSIIVSEDNPIFDSRNNCNAIIETTTNKIIAGCKNTIIPNSVTSIGNYSFYRCTGLTSITIPESVISIGDEVFYGCSALTSVTIGNKVTEIGSLAFAYCGALKSITIPKSVTSIGRNVIFETKPNSVTVKWENPISVPESSTSYIKYSTLYVPYGCKTAYEQADYWKSFKEIIEMEAPACAIPVLTFQNGKIHCTCETEGVKYVYSITPIPTTGESTDGIIELGTEFTVNVYATREEYMDSEPASITIDLASVGDLNGDGTISIADVTGLVNVILGK